MFTNVGGLAECQSLLEPGVQPFFLTTLVLSLSPSLLSFLISLLTKGGKKWS